MNNIITIWNKPQWFLGDMSHILKWGISPLYQKLGKENECEAFYDELDSLFSKNEALVNRSADFRNKYNAYMWNKIDYNSAIIRSSKMSKDYSALIVYYDKMIEITNTIEHQKRDSIIAGIEGNKSYYYILLKDFNLAGKTALSALEKDSTQYWIITNLAAALLFQGKYDEAEKIYRQFKYELKESFLGDFKTFAEAGVIPKECEADVERIRKILEE